AVGPGERERSQHREQADGERPRQDPVGTGAVEATLEAQGEQLVATSERELPPLAHVAGSSSGSISSIRCGPWLRTLFTSVLTGWNVMSELGAGTRNLPSRSVSCCSWSSQVS